MRFENEIIPFSSIDLSDHTFRITTEQNILELAESLKFPGLIHSPLLLESERRFIVISGFRRIRAGRHLGWPNLPARVADPATEKLECAQFAIADNVQQRQLNLIEVSRALNLLSGFFHQPEELAKMAAALALPGNLTVIKKIQRLCRLPQFVQELVAGGILALSMALELEKIAPAECTAFAELFKELQLSFGKQREIFNWVKEIAAREEKNSTAILAEEDIGRIRSDADLSNAQKTSQIRRYLKKRRYPTLVEVEKQFEKFKKDLTLCDNFKLIPPADFEGTEHVIRLHFNCLDELKTHQSILAGLIENDLFKKYYSSDWIEK